MPKRNAKSAISQVGETMMKATQAVFDTANDYVVHPVGTTLGLIEKKSVRPSADRRKALKTRMKYSKRRASLGTSRK